VKDLYQSLEVARTATRDEIKKAYRTATKKWHPDKNPGNKEAEEKFKAASTAYEVLSDDDKRKLYDEFGEMSLTQGFDAERARAYKQAQSGFGGGGYSGGFGPGFSPGGGSGIFTDFGEARETSFDDLLSRLFGGGRVRSDARRAPRSRKGADITGEIMVSFLDALAGVTVPLRIDSPDDSKSRTLDVKVPQGIADGGKLRLRGQGGPGQPAGDIILTVRVAVHAYLTRDGSDLKMNLPVTALEAYRGGPVDVPTPWGTLTVKLPAGSQNGQTLRLRGKGVQTSKGAGDLKVTLDVRMPAAGDDALLEALTRLQGDTDPRSSLGM
jgi:curved DNA-binding protein